MNKESESAATRLEPQEARRHRRRTVWARGQNAQQPVVFYSQRDSRSHELVITQVTKQGVVGHLLFLESR
jgi:hypothetical protein